MEDRVNEMLVRYEEKIEEGRQKEIGRNGIEEIIFFGDSRVVGMGSCCQGNIYIGKTSMGYDWMAGEGLSLLKQQMEAFPNADIVFCFGVNDTGNIGAYINFFNSFISQYPDRRIWFESVNPINDALARANGYFANDSMVFSFNEQLKAGIGESRYLDTYSFLVNTGYGTGDGVHYDSITYEGIQQMTKIFIEEKLAI